MSKAPVELPHVNDNHEAALSQHQGADLPWQGQDHPFSSLTPDKMVGIPNDVGQPTHIDMPPAFESGASYTPADKANFAAVESAVSHGSPVRFSSADENTQANRQPDYFLTTDGHLVKNPKAQPSSDGSINIQIQSNNPQGNKSLIDAIKYESKLQQDAGKYLIAAFQKDHPGQQPPGWMTDLANKVPQLPDFVPFQPAPNAPVQAPPENGFVPRGVSSGGDGGGHGGSSGSSGFAGNGGFDSNGYFKGNGSSGDGVIPTGSPQQLSGGETVQAKQLYDYFTEHGFSPAQASGILGNIQTESSFRTDALNKGEGAIGLCQWEGNRRTELESFAKEEGKPVTDWHVQADFIMYELNHSEKGAMTALKEAQTPTEAAAAFDKYYERSAGTSRGQREANAENIASHVGNMA